VSGWKGHLLGGSIVGSGIVWLLINTYGVVFSLQEYLLIVALIYVGSLAPDIDISTGTMRNLVDKIFLGLAIAGIAFYNYVERSEKFLLASIVLLAYLLSLEFAKHRGWYHSVWFLLLVSFIVFYLFGWSFALIFAGAMVSHFLLDGVVKV
jgi:membrane-bound metal-dependent hydrolase YbcI (DUF457 family)